MTYQEAVDKLGTRDRRKLGNNTYLNRRGNAIAVTLHNTDVVTLYPDGTYMLDSGGWFTVTTKARLNLYGPIRVRQERGQWWINEEQPFFNRMHLDGSGRILGPVAAQP